MRPCPVSDTDVPWSPLVSSTCCCFSIVSSYSSCSFCFPLACIGDGKCVVCDSHTRPTTIVRVCDECTAGSLAGRCVTCGSAGVSDAYYCAACTMLEKDRDGCPTIVNVGTAKADAFWANRKFGKGGGR